MGATSAAIFIVLGNERGGVGKTTLAANLGVAIARSGITAALLELDGRQRSLARWLERRVATARRNSESLTIPAHEVLVPARFDSISLNEERDFAMLSAAVERLDRIADVIVADTASGDSYLTRLAHSLADIVLTPVEDSFAARDLLAGGYGRTIAEARRSRDGMGDGRVDWIVVENRRGAVPGRADGAIGMPLAALAREHGFRTAPGLREQLVHRALFAEGRAVCDATPHEGLRLPLSATDARVAARQEVEALVSALYLPFAPTGISPTRRRMARASDPVG